ncbi:MAG: spore coat protein [Clostridia bacterium]|nr:spore coat protein [Clostridia bacterium]
MTLTEKETELLNDLKAGEELCIEKYRRYATDASDCALKGLFSTICSTEEGHLTTVNRILNGEDVSMTAPCPTAVSQSYECCPSAVSAEQKANDAFLCRDALAMEKHVSGLYNISVFEFSCPDLRDTLGHIEKEEQNHGMQLYQYLAANGMYGG